jgi:hypothetical protein
MSTPMHCPGFEAHKSLSSFTCNCPTCGKEREVFSDEFDRSHVCKGCGQQIDFAKVKIEPAK